MSWKNRHVPVDMVRMQLPDRKQPINHNNKVTVGILEDPDTNTAYLRINANQQTILSDELTIFQWIDKSSTDGVATIDSSSSKIIIIYNKQDESCRELFSNMKRLLQRGLQNEPSVPSIPKNNPKTEDQTKLATKDLLNYIVTGSLNGAEHAARYLAESRTNLQFNLINPNDRKRNITANKSEINVPSDTLRLKLQIECHLNKAPLSTMIDVRSGTKLRPLKDQIEASTGISHKDQYWYAFDRYLIDDEYEFGSSQAVVPPLPRNAPRKQTIPPTDPIRSGDTLILYLAQLRPYDK